MDQDIETLEQVPEEDEHVTTDEEHGEEEVTTEESDETVEEETSEDAETSETEEEGAEEEEPEYWESEEAFLAEKGLPGSPKSIDEVLNNYKNLLREFKRQQSLEDDASFEKPDHLGVQPTITPKATEAKAGEPIFTKNVATNHVESLIKAGQVEADKEQSLRASAHFMDSVLNPTITKMETAFNQVADVMYRVVGSVRKVSWDRFPYKKAADRARLDKIMNQYGLLDYETAFRQLVLDDPNMLGELQRTSEQRGIKKGKKLKIRRSITNRRGKPVSKPGQVWRPYVDRDGNLDEGKLSRLSIEKKEKIVDAYDDFLTKQRRR